MLFFDRSILLGTTKRGREHSMSPEDREAHLHVVGGSRKGKSKFLEHMIRKDIINNDARDKTTGGVCVIDPHGFLYDDLVNWCTEKRLFGAKKIVLFNPIDDNWTFGFNPLRTNSSSSSFLSDCMVALISKIWGDEDTNKTPRLKKFMHLIFHALIQKNLSLLEAYYLSNVIEKDVRMYLTRDIEDRSIRRIWESINKKSDKEFEDVIESSVNRIMEFISEPIIRNIVGQTEDTIDFSKAMDDGNILLMNLSSLNKISSDKSQLLGAMIVNDIFQVAKGRSKNSRPFYFYIDECSDYITKDIANILTQGSKFGLRLILAHQNLGQLRKSGDELYSAVMAVQNKVVFGGISVEDAEFLAKDLFINTINLQEPKKAFNKMSVMGYEKGILRGGSKGESHTETASSSSGSSFGSIMSEVTNLLNNEKASSSVGTTHTISNQHGSSSSDTYSESESWAEALIPILKSLPTQGYSLEEQIFKAMAKLVNQSKQHAIIKLADSPPLFLKTPTVIDGCATDEMVRQAVIDCYKQTFFVKPTKEIEDVIEARCLAIEQKAKKEATPVGEGDKEFDNYGRKCKKKIYTGSRITASNQPLHM